MKTTQAIADETGESTRTIQRYKKLLELSEPLVKMVDNGQSGLFVNMPTRKVGTQYEEICTILDENVKKEIRTALLEKYSQCNKSQQGEDDF